MIKNIKNMKLFIDTSKKAVIKIILFNNSEIIAEKELPANFDQAESLLRTIDNIIKRGRFKISDIKGILVNNQGNSFTSLRIGIVVANTLAYALNVPVEAASSFKHKFKKIKILENKTKISIVIPKYESAPNISKPKKT